MRSRIQGAFVANETILVVDGDTRSRKVLEVGFNKAGYRVVMTETMREALIELEREQPDLVVSDTDLPDGDGFELCKRVKEDPDLGYVPFLFLTDESSLPNKIKGLEIGADDYLTRPIYLREVTTRATVLLQKRTRKLLSESDVEEFEGELSDITMIDLLQTVEAENRTGTIHLERESRDAVVTFRDGNILDAACGKLQGTEAVYRLMLWPSGSFVVRYHDDVREGDHIEPDTQALIVEGIDRLQAWDGLVERLPSLERTYEADYQVLPDLLDEAPDTVGRIARLFDGVRTLRDVVDDSPMDDITTLQVVERLLDENVLRDVTPEGEISETDQQEATSHLAEWLESQGPDQQPDLGLESEGTVRPDDIGSTTAQTEETAQSEEALSVSNQEESAPAGQAGPAATMEDLEKAEEVRRQVEAQQLREQQTAPGEQQPEGRSGEDSKKGVPKIPGATQASDQQPPPEEVESDAEEESEGERDREDTPRAHPASSQDESVEAWLSEGPDVEEFDEAKGETGDSETRPQFPAVDIGSEVVGPEDAAQQPVASGSSPEDSTGSSVEPTDERREDAISRAESVSEQAHPPEAGEPTTQPATSPASGDESEGSDEGQQSEQAPSPTSHDIEETPTEALKTDIRPEDLTDELEPATSPESAAQEASGEQGPLDVERISNNGELVQTEYDLEPGGSSGHRDESSGASNAEPAHTESLAEETPVERSRNNDVIPETEEVGGEGEADFAAPGRQADASEASDEGDGAAAGSSESISSEPSAEDVEATEQTESASSTHEMWVDQDVPDADQPAGESSQPDSSEATADTDEQIEAKKQSTGETEPGGLAWGDEPSARPGESQGDSSVDEPASGGGAETTDTPASDDVESQSEPAEQETDQPGESAEAASDGLGDESTEPVGGAGEQADSEESAEAKSIEEDHEEASEASVEPSDEVSASQRETVEADERETKPADEAGMPVDASEQEASGAEPDLEAEQPEESVDSEDKQTDEESAEQAAGVEDEISEDTKEESFFEQGDELRDTREEEFDWEFEEAESSGADWQYWAVGAAVLALGVLGVMAATSSGLFGGKTTKGADDSSQAEAVGPSGDDKAAGTDTGMGAVAQADTGGQQDAGSEERAGLDRVSAKVVVKQQAKDVVDVAKTIAEKVEPESVAQQGGASGDGAGGAAGGPSGGGGANASTARVKQLMDSGQLVKAYEALKEARNASPGNPTVAQLHVQLGSKFQTTDDKNRARQVYRDYLNEWPDGRFAGQLQSILENQL
jgi:DNA-binding response OmpR family regulator